MKNSDFIRYLKDQSNPAWSTKFENWLKESPSNQSHFDEFKKIWSSLDSYRGDYKPNEEKAWNNLQIEMPSKESVNKASRRIPILRIAAAIFVLLMIGSGLLYSVWNVRGNKFAVVYHSADSISRITLPDQSEIWLNKNSTLAVSRSFTRATRKVRLEGEAFFEVEKDPKHPFVVTFNKSAVEVLGTSFNIKTAGFDDEATVTVNTGKVAFTRNRYRKEKVFLLPGQQVSYNPGEDSIHQSLVADQNYMVWKTGTFRFSDTPLNQVFSALSNYFESGFNVEGDVSLDLSLSGNFSVASLDEIIEAIEMTFDLEVMEDSAGNYQIHKPR